LMFNATFSNISVISWRLVLLVDETGEPREPPTCRKSLTNALTLPHNAVWSTPRIDRYSNS
jgi:hypothetical protein